MKYSYPEPIALLSWSQSTLNYTILIIDDFYSRLKKQQSRKYHEPFKSQSGAYMQNGAHLKQI